MKPDTLTTCPDCGTPNIYSRALAAHRKSKNCAERRKARPLHLTDLEVLPPVRRVSKGKPVSLDVLETQIRDFLGADQAREREYQNAAIYDRVAIGLCLLKGRELHLQKAGRPKNCGNGSTISAKAEGKADLGFIAWLETKFPGFSTRTARNYMNGARNCGLTADHSLEDVDALRTAQALHDKTAKELYRLEDALKDQPDHDDQAPAPNLVAAVQLDLFRDLDQALQLRDEFSAEDYEATFTRIKATLERFTGCEWVMTDKPVTVEAGTHGELQPAELKKTAKAKPVKKKAAKKKADFRDKIVAKMKARWAARSAGKGAAK